jgi:hypothetical protein
MRKHHFRRGVKPSIKSLVRFLEILSVAIPTYSDNPHRPFPDMQISSRCKTFGPCYFGSAISATRLLH